MEADQIITRISLAIKQLEDLKDSNDIVGIGSLCNDLALASSYFAKLVADAYEVANECEDEYKQSVSATTENLTSSLAFNRAEAKAEIENSDKKKDWTKAKAVYNRYKLYLDRIDRVLDTFKQYTSSVKMIDLKHGI